MCVPGFIHTSPGLALARLVLVHPWLCSVEDNASTLTFASSPLPMFVIPFSLSTVVTKFAQDRSSGVLGIKPLFIRSSAVRPRYFSATSADLSEFEFRCGVVVVGVVVVVVGVVVVGVVVVVVGVVVVVVVVVVGVVVVVVVVVGVVVVVVGVVVVGVVVTVVVGAVVVGVCVGVDCCVGVAC